MDQRRAWRPQSRAIDLAKLPSQLARYPVVIVHFWAAWNPHDRKMEETLQRLMPRYAGRVEFRSHDVDISEGHDFCRDCHIGNVPALVAFVRGVWIETLIGLREPVELEDRLRDWLRTAELRDPMWDEELDSAL